MRYNVYLIISYFNYILSVITGKCRDSGLTGKRSDDFDREELCGNILSEGRGISYTNTLAGSFSQVSVEGFQMGMEEN